MVLLTNQMSCVDKITKLQKIERILRAFTYKFDHKVISIKESKNISEMKLEELQATLEAHEMRSKHRNHVKVLKQALQDEFFKKMKDNASNINKGK